MTSKPLYVFIMLLFCIVAFLFYVGTTPEESGAIGGRYIYYVDPNATDQGLASTRGSRTVKDFVDAIGSTKKAILKFVHTDSGNTTAYTFLTAETITSNFELSIEKGAEFSPASGITVTINSPHHIDAGPRQQIKSGAGTIGFTNKGKVYPQWWGALADGSAENASELTEAINCGAGHVYFPEGTYIIESSIDMTDDSDVYLVFPPGSILSVNSGVTVTSYAPDHIIASPNYQVFSGSGAIDFANTGTVYPDWWGIDGTEDDTEIELAVDSLPSTGGVVELLTGSYSMDTDDTVTMDSTSNVTIRGQGKYATKLVADSTSTPILFTISGVTDIEFSDLFADRCLVSMTDGGNLNVHDVLLDGISGVSSYMGNGILVYAVDGVSLHDSKIINWTNSGILCYDNASLVPTKKVRVDNVHFEHERHNHSGTNPVAVWVEEAEDVVVSNCVFKNIIPGTKKLAAPRGWAIYVDKPNDSLVVSNCIIHNDTTATDIGGIMAEDVRSISITGTTFRSDVGTDNDWGFKLGAVDGQTLANEISIVGCILHYASIIVTGNVTPEAATSCSIIGNQLTYGMIQVRHADARITPASIIGNTIKYATGIAIDYYGSGVGIIKGNQVIDCNTADTATTAGIYVGGGTSIITGNYIANETSAGLMDYGIELATARQQNLYSNNLVYGVGVRIQNGHTTTPNWGTWTDGDVVWYSPQVASSSPGTICVVSGTFSAATDGTGDNTLGNGIIDGMGDTSDFAAGQWITTSKGFPNSVDDGNVPVRILSVDSGTQITIDDTADTTETDITVLTPDPDFVAIAASGA